MTRTGMARTGMARRLIALLVLALAVPAAGIAQTTDPAPDPAMTDPAVAPDCAAEFAALDTDGNGYVSAAESPSYAARAAVDGMTAGAEGLSQDDHLAICGSDSWSNATPQAGAPFEGANSFTEDQARERAVAWNVTDVSALVQDEQGIWRGTGMVAGNAVSVAIDYRGNVVTTPTNK